MQNRYVIAIVAPFVIALIVCIVLFILHKNKTACTKVPPVITQALASQFCVHADDKAECSEHLNNAVAPCLYTAETASDMVQCATKNAADDEYLLNLMSQQRGSVH
jgi:hypothetical protein